MLWLGPNGSEEKDSGSPRGVRGSVACGRARRMQARRIVCARCVGRGGHVFFGPHSFIVPLALGIDAGRSLRALGRAPPHDGVWASAEVRSPMRTRKERRQLSRQVLLRGYRNDRTRREAALVHGGPRGAAQRAMRGAGDHGLRSGPQRGILRKAVQGRLRVHEREALRDGAKGLAGYDGHAGRARKRHQCLQVGPLCLAPHARAVQFPT